MATTAPGPTPEQLDAVTAALLEVRAELDRLRLTLLGVGDALDGINDTLVRAEYGDGPDPFEDAVRGLD